MVRLGKGGVLVGRGVSDLRLDIPPFIAENGVVVGLLIWLLLFLVFEAFGCVVCRGRVGRASKLEGKRITLSLLGLFLSSLGIHSGWIIGFFFHAYSNLFNFKTN